MMYPFAAWFVKEIIHVVSVQFSGVMRLDLYQFQIEG